MVRPFGPVASRQIDRPVFVAIPPLRRIACSPSNAIINDRCFSGDFIAGRRELWDFAIDVLSHTRYPWVRPHSIQESTTSSRSFAPANLAGLEWVISASAQKRCDGL